MSFFESDSAFISMALDRVENLSANEYLIVFGPDGKQFLATPNGCSATYLPSRIVAELANPATEKVLWASYGDAPDSWFFSYRLHDGRTVVRLGDGITPALHDYLNRLKESTQDLFNMVRVQLGAHGSFVAWVGTAWACYNVPASLHERLLVMSSGTRAYNGMTLGSTKSSFITNVQWHSDGSHYIRKSNNAHAWHFVSSTMHHAWKELWGDVKGPLTSEHLAELAYVAMNGHAPTSDTFAFIKKQKTGEAPFILHFAEEPIHARLSKPVDQRLVYLDSIPTAIFRWAVTVKAGRSHDDPWELNLKKGQKVKVIKEEERNWYVAVDQKGHRGFVHGTYLDFSERKKSNEPQTAWKRFEDDTDKMFGSRTITNFPNMRDYMDVCTSPACQVRKQDPSLLGICHHDLEELLRGSGQYSPVWLKDERNMWHPDRFARFCMPEHAERLKVKAQELFVLYGVLMEQS